MILLAAIAFVLYILLKRAQAAPPHKRRSEYIKLGLGVAVVVVVVLALAGKMHWIGVAATGLLVALRQLARHYGLIQDDAAAVHAVGRLRHWGAAGYRPEI